MGRRERALRHSVRIDSDSEKEKKEVTIGGSLDQYWDQGVPPKRISL